MLDLLFSNPLILLIVLGLISMLFRQRKEAAPARPRQPGEQRPTMPTFANEEPQQVKGFGKQAPVVREAQPDYVAALEAYEQAERAKPEMREARSARSFPRMASVPEAEAEKREHLGNQRRLTVEEARLGMMWAEVFGQPRAKRPFRK